MDKLTDRILAYKPVKVKGSLLKKVGVPKKKGKKTRQRESLVGASEKRISRKKED